MTTPSQDDEVVKPIPAVDWKSSDSIVTTWARLNVNSHLYGTIARWIIAANDELAEMKRQREERVRKAQERIERSRRRHLGIGE